MGEERKQSTKILLRSIIRLIFVCFQSKFKILGCQISKSATDLGKVSAISLQVFPLGEDFILHLQKRTQNTDEKYLKEQNIHLHSFLFFKTPKAVRQLCSFMWLSSQLDENESVLPVEAEQEVKNSALQSVWELQRAMQSFNKLTKFKQNQTCSCTGYRNSDGT